MASAVFERRAIAPVLALVFGSLVPSIVAAAPDQGIAFDVAHYEELHERDRETLEFVLGAMREAIFYAQHSIGRPVICATPIPIPGPELVTMVDEELQDPSNPEGRAYTKEDLVATVLVTALKHHNACQ